MQQIISARADVSAGDLADQRLPHVDRGLFADDHEDAAGSPLIPQNRHEFIGAGPQKAGWQGPSVQLQSNGSSLELRINHELRDLIAGTADELGAFVKANLRGPAEFGLRAKPRENVRVDGLIASLQSAQEKLEHISVDRGDGFATSITLRSVAGAASVALEHTLISLITSTRGDSLPETEVPEVLHALTQLKSGLRDLVQQFDGSMLEYVQQSGILQKALAPDQADDGHGEEIAEKE